ncbi:class I SAM-dependent methyltransferase [Aliiroseovarius sp.]|uniref:class I SAM-dependent methyltransferase n=1 Tax=Aliiroseovarius sp. TaxID=1872442 RepID=UPI003BAB158A
MNQQTPLTEQLEALGPWHHRIALQDGVVTQSASQTTATGQNIMSYEPKRAVDRILGRIFPDGLQGRSFLDCGCNAGGASFAAQDLGAGRIYGFDARAHWVDQARFALQNRTDTGADIRFEVATLEALEGHDQDYDITWFSGLFQHLPDPVAGLQAAADRTRELLVVNTPCLATDLDMKEEPTLLLQKRDTAHPLSGIDGLGTLPSGPVVLKGILKWLGFGEVKTYMWHQPGDAGSTVRRGRIALVAARTPGLLDQVPDRNKPTLSS